MLMRMLDAGGLPAVHDGTSADCNPGGLFELQALRADPVRTLRPLVDRAVCVKVWPVVVPELLAAGIRPAAVVSPDRPAGEVDSSWRRWFAPIPADQADRARNLTEARNVLADAGIPVLAAAFHDLVDKPYASASRIAEFLAPWVTLDVDAMAAIPDPTLRHFGVTT